MNRQRKRQVTALNVAAFSLLFTSPCYAYLDPGTGSILLQGLLAGFAVAIGLLRGYWHQFKSFFAKRTAGEGDKEDVDEADFEQTSNLQSKP